MLNLNTKNMLIIAFVLALGLGIAVESTQVFSGPYEFQGSLIDPASPAPDFSLPATTGENFHLKDQRGDIVLLFFGFTHCPDICPTTLNDFRQIRKELGDDAQQVEFVFITVDPERDNMDTIKEYVSIFDTAIIGLTAEQEALQPVWDAYGIYHKKRDVDSAAGYVVDHTARIYVVDQEGNLRMTFPQGMPPQAMADDVNHLLNEN